MRSRGRTGRNPETGRSQGTDKARRGKGQERQRERTMSEKEAEIQRGREGKGVAGAQVGLTSVKSLF